MQLESIGSQQIGCFSNVETQRMSKYPFFRACKSCCCSGRSAVAVTPAAQNHRFKRVPSIYPKSNKAYLSADVAIVVNHSDVPDKHLQISTMHDPYSNGVCYDNVHGLSDVGKQGKIFWGTKWVPPHLYI